MTWKKIPLKGTIKLTNSVLVDWDNTKSIKEAEKKGKKLENDGWNLKNTKQVGFNKFKMIYEKKIKQVV